MFKKFEKDRGYSRNGFPSVTYSKNGDFVFNRWASQGVIEKGLTNCEIYYSKELRSIQFRMFGGDGTTHSYSLRGTSKTKRQVLGNLFCLKHSIGVFYGLKLNVEETAEGDVIFTTDPLPEEVVCTI